MIEQPEVNVRNLSLSEAVSLCSKALLDKGISLNQEELYKQAEATMKKQISNSKARIRTLAILSQYCKILEQ